MTNTIVAGNTSGCFAGFFGSGPVVLASGGATLRATAPAT
jgi:hypothetical protein